MAERMTFPMYAIHRQQTQALWQAVQSLLAERGVMVAGDPPAADPGDLLAHWRQPTLLLSQTCGYPLVTQLPEVQTVGCFHYAAPGCEGRRYRSLLVVREADSHRMLGHFFGRRAVCNAEHSQSGYNVLRKMVAPLSREGRFFSAVMFSGSHRQSLRELQQENADIAAIDCVTYALLQRHQPHIGTYTYKDIVIENGIPAIIDKELFETVQRRLSKTATAPARGKAKVDYLLSGKLFCGHCGASMNGESGAGRHGKVYHYYSCYTKKRKLGCDKRPLKKDYIEGIVARDALNLLTDQLIDEIADMAIRQSEQDLINDTHIPQLTAQLSEIEKSIMNITAAIEKGIASETLMNRLVQLEHEKKTLNKEIKAEEKFVYRIDRDQIVFWLSQFKYGNIEDENFRRRLIDLLVNSVTVWDEPDGYKITTAYNLTSCKTKTFRVDKNPAAEEATGFDFGESECTKKPHQSGYFKRNA